MVTYIIKRASIAGAFLIYGILFWPHSTYAAQTVRVQQVVDGDTLRLADGRKVRLIGVNTPEPGYDGNPDEPLAVKARDALKNIIAARAISLKMGPDKKDHYGRVLAYVILPDGSSAGEKILQTGLASMIVVPPNVEHVARYRLAEASARQQRLGIWALNYYQPIAAEALDANAAGYRFIKGRIKRVGESRKYIYFDLSRDFSIAIKREHWHYFGGNPRSWLGRKVVARGWVSRWRDKLRLPIGHPAMLELTD